ncbi:hypothetical protein K505DRAFT_322998 [Melanomma pulvis-pyrius CBS 109.77]|uniref:Uncharacterized protein n=1 Tax=Melanomma pulvis-pyrius CBS 109.77 TaxID=1314802 RepID=A0A6A6XK28_9PLEO|nr:hypothetical protein K505DRAFT_322998 [Melanomma pulvis-pyrius CBS 109.77]
MEILDAYYNGSFSLTITPPSSNSTFDCPELKSQVIPDAYFRVGPQSRNNITRKAYGDENSYYFQFGRTLVDEKCPYTANKAFVSFESSNDELEQAQGWTLNQKKNGDKFELDGTLTSNAAHYNNYWNYVVNTTGTDIDYPRKCPTLFSLRALLASTGAKMNATVTATAADLTFAFQDTKQPGYTITGSFSGQHWDKGAHLVFSADTIQTEGETTHVKPRAPKNNSFFARNKKWIIIGACVGGAIIVAVIIWKCFSCLASCFSCCCNRPRRLAHKKHVKEMEARDTWHAEQQQGKLHADTTPKQPAHFVAPVPSPAPESHPQSQATQISYVVSPLVAQSYGLSSGPYVAEIVAGQEGLNTAHLELNVAYDALSAQRAEAMIRHHTALVEHYMMLRRTQGF